MQAFREVRPRITQATVIAELASDEYCALAGATSPPALSSPSVTRSLARGWREGFITNCLNPEVSLFYLAEIPQFIGKGSNAAAALLTIVMIHIAVNAMWFMLVAVLIERLTQTARYPTFMRLFNLFSGLALIGPGASFAASAAAQTF